MWTAGVSVCAVAALGVSVAELGLNSVLLPRLVVFGSAVLLIPWFVLCATLARAARSRAEERERLVFVGRLDEGQLLRDELEALPGATRAARRRAHVRSSFLDGERASADRGSNRRKRDPCRPRP